jgi:hypothetical protein
MNEPAFPYRTVASILITVALGAVAGRILSVARLYDPALARAEGDTTSKLGKWRTTRPEPMPTHGDNDRSRWDTVRALVDNGTYAIGHRDVDPETGKYQDTGIASEDGWTTIDKVMNPETHDFYSSKPPLLPTLVAGGYWLLKTILGWSIVEDRWLVIRTLLVAVNLLPFWLYLVLMARLLERLGTSDWGRLYVLAAACFGTMLTAFANTFNNHSVATYSALFALYPALLVWSDPNAPGTAGRLFLAGLLAGFTATSELPAASFAGLLGLLLLVRAPLRTIVCYVPGILIPLAAFLWTNYQAIGEFTPAYEKFGGPWYEFEGSHWKDDPDKPKTGIDWAWRNEPRGVYAFHVLLGHHGLFSLTPVFLFSVVGLLAFWGYRNRNKDRPPGESLVAILATVLSLVVMGFYTVWVPDRQRNYGGWTAGPRWLMWLTPFLLLAAAPVADWLGRRRWGRGLAYVFLAVSVLSAGYQVWNPWRHPWLYNLMDALDWIDY